MSINREHYQITEINPELYHAGSKAIRDVAQIAEAMGFTVASIKSRSSNGTVTGKVKRQICFIREYKKVYRQIPYGAVVLLQHPFHHVQLTRMKTLKRLKTKKQVSFICFVHDVQEIRSATPDRYYHKEFEFMLYIADVLVVHNRKMYEWFVQKGVDPNKLVVLELFDYLVSSDENPEPVFERSITVAGNLDPRKAGYIYSIPDGYGLDIHLYGPNYRENVCRNKCLRYHGIFDPGKIPEGFYRGFMLIWDGESIEDCTGGFGSYLQYNIPHKLSLSIAAALPVIVWEKAATAQFVAENHLGLVVSDLVELPEIIRTIDEHEYRKMVDSVRGIRRKIINGHYTKQALRKSLNMIERDDKNE